MMHIQLYMYYTMTFLLCTYASTQKDLKNIIGGVPLNPRLTTSSFLINNPFMKLLL